MFIGKNAKLNFPDSASLLPIRVSLSARDIQVAAGAAAAAVGAANDTLKAQTNVLREQEQQARILTEFMDEDLIFDMPNVLDNMAQGMLLSPPRLDIGGELDNLEKIEQDL